VLGKDWQHATCISLINNILFAFHNGKQDVLNINLYVKINLKMRYMIHSNTLCV
jgi:hypothetical protein